MGRKKKKFRQLKRPVFLEGTASRKGDTKEKEEKTKKQKTKGNKDRRGKPLEK